MAINSLPAQGKDNDKQQIIEDTQVHNVTLPQETMVKTVGGFYSHNNKENHLWPFVKLKLQKENPHDLYKVGHKKHVKKPTNGPRWSCMLKVERQAY